MSVSKALADTDEDSVIARSLVIWQQPADAAKTMARELLHSRWREDYVASTVVSGLDRPRGHLYSGASTMIAVDAGDRVWWMGGQSGAAHATKSGAAQPRAGLSVRGAEEPGELERGDRRTRRRQCCRFRGGMCSAEAARRSPLGRVYAWWRDG